MMVVVYSVAATPAARARLEVSMDSSDVALGLSKLRRELEEILVMVKAGHDRAALNRSVDAEAVSTVGHECDAATESNIVLGDDQPELVRACEPAPSEIGPPDARDDLYDDALVVVTEFGQASPAILQMWLSIDYGRATKILSRFQADGLISSKGKVRHLAFSRRRSLEQQG